MLTRAIHTTHLKRVTWLLLAAGVLALATPRAAHAHPGHEGPALVIGAALGYALHDLHGRNRAYFYHDAHRHYGWRGCRERAHFRAAPGYRHIERGYYRTYRDDRRGWRAHRERGYRAHRHYGYGH
jgi:hypothetical protein